MGVPLLKTANIIKKFPGVIALKGVDFELMPGEIHSLCGENGAGKSTLIKILSGIHPWHSYEGGLFVEEHQMKFTSLKDAERKGIAVIYQELALVEEMTVAENIFLGREPTRLGLINWNKMYSDAKTLLDQFKIAIDPVTPLGELGVGQQQLVEIVKALGKKSRVLILDEPTSALTEKEVDILLKILQELRQEGISCIYISHKLDEVFAISDRITALRDGESITTVEAKNSHKNEIIHHMVGREIKDLFPRRACSPGKALLKIKNLEVKDKIKKQTLIQNVSFEVCTGEVLGIGGLMGAGRTELLMHIFGAWGERIGGDIELNGQILKGHSPAESIKKGLVLVSEDRKIYGLILEQTIGFNLSLSSLNMLTKKGFIDRNLEFQHNKEFFESLRIKAPSLNSVVENLSGGNQQKVVLGKAMMSKPKVVFLDEPTRGIDVGAKLEVYELINKLTTDGHAVVLVSSELPELMGMSDRIIMLYEGKIGGFFASSEATQEKLMAAAIGQNMETNNAS